jgi:hypothetical protein
MDPRYGVSNWEHQGSAQSPIVPAVAAVVLAQIRPRRDSLEVE